MFTTCMISIVLLAPDLTLFLIDTMLIYVSQYELIIFLSCYNYVP